MEKYWKDIRTADAELLAPGGLIGGVEPQIPPHFSQLGKELRQQSPDRFPVALVDLGDPGVLKGPQLIDLTGHPFPAGEFFRISPDHVIGLGTEDAQGLDADKILSLIHICAADE